MLIAAKLPADAMTVDGHRRRIFLREAYGQRSKPAADRDERCFGPEHCAEAECGQRGEGDGWKLAPGCRTTAGLEAKCG